MSNSKILSGDLPTQLYEVFRFIFIENCKIDDQSMTEEEARTLEELDAMEVLDNFRTLALNLLNFKQEHKGTDKAELLKRLERSEDVLKGLEQEIKGYVKTEQKLLFQIDSLQNKVNDLEKDNKKANARVSHLEAERNIHGKEGSLEDQMKELEKRFRAQIYQITKDFQESMVSTKENARSDCSEELERYKEIAEKRLQTINLLEQQCFEYQDQYREKAYELEKLKAKHENVLRNFQVLRGSKSKKKLSKEKFDLAGTIRGCPTSRYSSGRVSPRRSVCFSKLYSRKSSSNLRQINELELMKQSTKALKKDVSGMSSKTQIRPQSVNKRRSQGHLRSSSENFKKLKLSQPTNIIQFQSYYTFSVYTMIIGIFIFHLHFFHFEQYVKSVHFVNFQIIGRSMINLALLHLLQLSFFKFLHSLLQKQHNFVIWPYRMAAAHFLIINQNQ